MKLATTMFVALTTSSILAAPIARSESHRGGRVQVMAVDVSRLRREFYEVGWMRSFYVGLSDTYPSFVSGQLNRLADGDYSGLMPEIRALAEDLDDEAESGTTREVRGGWEPVGWGDCEDARDLVLLRRRLH